MNVYNETIFQSLCLYAETNIPTSQSVCVFIDSICHILYYFNLKQQIFAQFSSISHNTKQFKIQNRKFKVKRCKFLGMHFSPLPPPEIYLYIWTPFPLKFRCWCRHWVQGLASAGLVKSKCLMNIAFAWQEVLIYYSWLSLPCQQSPALMCRARTVAQQQKNLSVSHQHTLFYLEILRGT